MSNLEKIKQIAEQMPESPEKQTALQAYSNLKTFEVIADSFESLMNISSGKAKEKGRQEKNSESNFDRSQLDSRMPRRAKPLL